jgi:5'-AMP-activated protein kinase catalytic alpha subunit
MDELKIPIARVQREIDNIRLCKAQPRLVCLCDVYDDTWGDVVLVKNYASGGDLYNDVTSEDNHRLAPEEARRFFQQIIVGVEYIHYKNIAHCES